MANFGLDQINNPAPLFIKRLCGALTMFVLPAYATLIAGLAAGGIVSTKTALIMSLSAPFINQLAKGLEYLLGSEPTQVITDTETGETISPK